MKVGADRNPSALTSHLSALSVATVKAFGGRLSLLIEGTSDTVEIALRRLATIKTRPTALCKEVLCYRLDVDYIDLDLTHNAVSNRTTWCNLLPVMSRLWDDYFPWPTTTRMMTPIERIHRLFPSQDANEGPIALYLTVNIDEDV